MRVEWVVNKERRCATRCPNCEKVIAYCVGDVMGKCNECKSIFGVMPFTVNINWTDEGFFGS